MLAFSFRNNVDGIVATAFIRDFLSKIICYEQWTKANFPIIVEAFEFYAKWQPNLGHSHF